MQWKNFYVVQCIHRVWNPSPNPNPAVEIFFCFTNVTKLNFRSPASRLATSPYGPNQRQGPGKSRLTSRDTPRDSMPATRSQNNVQSNKSSRVDNNNSNHGNHSNHGNNSNNSNNVKKTPRVDSKNKNNTTDSSTSSSHG